MPARRIEAGPVLAVVGAVVLLVALFLEWYQPGLTAWKTFELVDLVLAALAVGAIAAAGTQLGVLPAPDPRALPWCCLAAFVVVAVTLLSPPPAAPDAAVGTGLWLALGATVAMSIGAILSGSRVRVSVDVEARRRRVSPVAVVREEEDLDDGWTPSRREVEEDVDEVIEDIEKPWASRQSDDDDDLWAPRPRREPDAP